MNTYIYQAIHVMGNHSERVCFPIRTDKTYSELCDFLKQKATKLVVECREDNEVYPYEFCPFHVTWTNDVKFLTTLCLTGEIGQYIIPIHMWKGVDF